MARKKLLIVVVILILIGGYIFMIKQNGISPTFNPDGRYEWHRLDYMGVIYQNQSDIYAFNEGYSESDNCPWGFVHNGIDYFFNNGSPVIAAAPGQVESITWTDNGEGASNRFYITVLIRFNATTIIHYNFEPFTQNAADKDTQLNMLGVSAGDWVAKGDKIATFLHVNGGAHIHFGVIQDGQWQCPRPYFSDADYTELMDLVHSYHPTWDLCYP